jgi:glycosyltransferase involved in cell wall biosynthesis
VKLFVQIPCLDEEATLPSVIRDIPRYIQGVDEVKVLVIDDGSHDRTAEVASVEGADYVLHLPYTQGLARAFSAGINRCLELGADIIVNTDGDHQYEGKDIPRLIQPILDGRADIVIGNRQVRTLAHFSVLKKSLQKLGSRTVGILSSVQVPDATSGFRAYSREAALRLNVFSKFTYTLETIIQAGKNQIAVAHVPIQANGPIRQSRLFANIPTYLKRSIATILRIYALYEPLRTLFYIGGVVFFIGMVGVLRFLFFWLIGDGVGHVQSLIISSALLILGFQVWVVAIVADLISVNRRLSEEILYTLKRHILPLWQEVEVTPENTSPRHLSSTEKISKAM